MKDYIVTIHYHGLPDAGPESYTAFGIGESPTETVIETACRWMRSVRCVPEGSYAIDGVLITAGDES